MTKSIPLCKPVADVLSAIASGEPVTLDPSYLTIDITKPATLDEVIDLALGLNTEERERLVGALIAAGPDNGYVPDGAVQPLDGALGDGVDIDGIFGDVAEADPTAHSVEWHGWPVSISPPPVSILRSMKAGEYGALLLGANGRWIYAGNAAKWLAAAPEKAVAHVCRPDLQNVDFASEYVFSSERSRVINQDMIGWGVLVGALGEPLAQGAAQ